MLPPERSSSNPALSSAIEAQLAGLADSWLAPMRTRASELGGLLQRLDDVAALAAGRAHEAGRGVGRWGSFEALEAAVAAEDAEGPGRRAMVF